MTTLAIIVDSTWGLADIRIEISAVLLSMSSAGISIGSEMSGGVEDVVVDRVHIWGSRRGVRIKTSTGRGGYVKNILYTNLTLHNVKMGIVIKTDYGDHPDSGFDPQAFPQVANISFHGVFGSKVMYPVVMAGSQEVFITGIEIRNMNVSTTNMKKNAFQCSYLQGKVVGHVFPSPCKELVRQIKVTRETTHIVTQ